MSSSWLAYTYQAIMYHYFTHVYIKAKKELNVKQTKWLFFFSASNVCFVTWVGIMLTSIHQSHFLGLCSKSSNCRNCKRIFCSLLINNNDGKRVIKFRKCLFTLFLCNYINKLQTDNKSLDFDICHKSRFI